MAVLHLPETLDFKMFKHVHVVPVICTKKKKNKTVFITKQQNAPTQTFQSAVSQQQSSVLQEWCSLNSWLKNCSEHYQGRTHLKFTSETEQQNSEKALVYNFCMEEHELKEQSMIILVQGCNTEGFKLN